MADLQFDGDVVLLTGAAAGLGRAYAEHLACRGARLVLNDIDASVIELADSLRGLGAEAHAVIGSVSDPATATAMTACAIAQFGRIDALINNAGIARRKPAATTSLAEHRLLMEINYFGALQMSQAALPAMQSRGYGRIVNIVSTSLFGADGFSAYAATKGALLGYTRCAAPELRSHGVLINLLAPGAATPMTRAAGLEAEALAFLEQNALAEQVAPVVAWLVHRSCDCAGVTFSSAGGATSIMGLAESERVKTAEDQEAATALPGLVQSSRDETYPMRESLR